MGKGIYMILRYLWNYATEEQKEEAKSIIENYLRIKFQKYYVPDDGAFSYYPGEGHASLDGTGGACSLLKEVGAFSADKQNHLWGYPWKNIIDHGKFRISEIRTEELAMITADKAVNSLRVYRELPDSGNLSRGVIAVIYPGKESYPDIMELIPEVDRWLDKQSLSIGNWTSREEIRNNYTSFEIKDIPVYKELNTDRLNKILSGEGELHLIGFDILQIPRCKISWIRAVPKEASRLQSRSFPQSREANKIRKP
jgi:hypothetical protein